MAAAGEMSDKIASGPPAAASRVALGGLITVRGVVVFAVATAALVALSRRNFLLAHCLVEFWSVGVAMLIFVFSRHKWRVARRGYLEFIGLVYGAVGVLDLVHTLAYRGMGVLPHSATANVATQLWVAARWLEAAGLLLAPWMVRLTWPRRLTAAALGSYVLAVLLAVLHTGSFPACFREGEGLTDFKVASEWVVCGLLVGAMASLYANRRHIGRLVTGLMALSVLLTVVAELLFTAYSDVYAPLNMLGHAFRGASFYCIYLITVCKGLTEPLEFRRRAELALREQDRRLRLAMDGAHVGFWEWRAENDRLTLDPQCFRAVGYQEPAANPVTYAEFARVVHPDDLARLDACMDAHTAGRIPYADVDLRVRGADRDWRWVQVRGHTVEADAAGRPRCIVGFIQDITSRKEAEAEVAELRGEMARASRANIAGQLLAAVAHEINQPLAAICSNAQAALRFLAERPPRAAEIPPILEDIAADGQRASDVVTRLRDLIRGGKTGKPIETEVQELVDGVLTIARHDLTMHHVAVRTEVAPDLPRLLADRVQVQQVLLNLIRNAVESMAGNAAAAREALLAVRAAVEGTALHLSVEDNGCGIAAEHPESVFLPFRTSRAEGIGMGLSICRGIVEAHKGRIWWTRNAGHGVTFHVLLPLDAART